MRFPKMPAGKALTVAVMLSGAAALTAWLCRPAITDPERPSRSDSATRAAARTTLLPPGRSGTFTARIEFRLMPNAGWQMAGKAELEEAVLTPDALGRVSEALSMEAKWNATPDAATATLRQMTSVLSDHGNPPVVSVRVKSADKEAALAVADALVEDFRGRLEAVESDRNSRISAPVYRRIRELTGAVERTRAEMLECLNRQGIVDYAFLDQLNGGPGVIHPDLDASLSPDVKLAWFAHQLESLASRPPADLISDLAEAVMPFDDPACRKCQDWKTLVPIAAAVEGSADAVDESLDRGLAFMREQAIEAVVSYRQKLALWVEQTTAALESTPVAEGPPPGNDGTRRDEYNGLKSLYEARAAELKMMQDHAANIFGAGGPIYVPPLIILRRSVTAS